MKMNKLLALLLALVMVLSFAACNKPAEEPNNDQPGEETNNDEPTNITVQIGPNPETLDPALNSAVDGGNMLITLFETLLIVDENGNCVPGQAESYTVSEDGLTWVLTMRDGLKWSDGTELNAKDFEYTFKRIVDPVVAAPYGETVWWSWSVWSCKDEI